jgi:outer membrane protein assembly factor BamD (BamD/ComL family)
MKPGTIPQVMSLVVIAAVLSSGGCSLFKTRGPGPPLFHEDFSLLRPEDFSGKIQQLEAMSQRDPSTAVRSQAVFYLALAHMHYKNPSPDYAKAVQYLDKYVALESARKDIDEKVAWKSVIQALDNSLREREKLVKSYAQLKQQYDGSTKNGEALARTVEKQKKEIEGLKQTIKELDAVQQEIEKKRKGIRK